MERSVEFSKQTEEGIDNHDHQDEGKNGMGCHRKFRVFQRIQKAERRPMSSAKSLVKTFMVDSSEGEL